MGCKFPAFRVVSRLVTPFFNEELEDPFEKPSSYENNSEKK